MVPLMQRSPPRGVRRAFPMEPPYQHGSFQGLQKQRGAQRRNHAAIEIGFLRLRPTLLLV
jgi:hypothetical protein